MESAPQPDRERWWNGWLGAGSSILGETAYSEPVGQQGTTTLLVGDLIDGRRQPQEIPWNIVDVGFFRTLGVPLLHGRVFDERDGPDDPFRAVVTEAFATGLFGRAGMVGESLESRESAELRAVGVPR